MSSRLFACLLIGSLCFTVILGGCGGSELSLNLRQGDTTTYKSTIETFRIIKYEGPRSEKNDALKGGRSGNKVEMVFSQQIESVDEAGNALANIIIKQLKLHSVINNKTGTQFDSTAQKESNSALAKLVGASYKITLGSNGKVVNVVDASQAKIAVQGAADDGALALHLLAPELITARHSIDALHVDKKDRSKKWSNIISFNLGMMGTKSYERVYTRKGIRGKNATIKMKGIPTGELEEGAKESGSSMGPFEKMFDNVETYTGQLVINLDNGKIKKYFENLDTKWIIIMPVEKTSGTKEVDMMTMNFIDNFSLEKLE